MARLFGVMLVHCSLGFTSLLIPSAVAQSPDDQAIRMRIEGQLSSDIRLRDLHLDIDVMAGRVTLDGELPSFIERNRLERICRQIEGVDSIINRITVAPRPETQQGLQRAVKRRLQADPLLASSEIQVEADGGTIKLTGVVSSLLSMRRAQSVAEQVRGVARVQNELTRQPAEHASKTVADDQIELAIREVLGKDDRSLEQPIDVNVLDGVVTLEGVVRGYARRRFYRYLIERIPGVRQVMNRLEVRVADPGEGEHRPSLEDATRDVQMALDVAELPNARLRAQMADAQIAIVGKVASLDQQQKLLRLARDFAAGYPLVNAMEVASLDRSAERMRSELNELIGTDALLADASIQIDVHDQVATLSGHVERFADKLRAERLASTVPGISSIENQLAVDWMATVSDEVLKERIEERWRRNRLTANFMDEVTVTVTDGRVSLKGRVSNPEARGQLGIVASRTDGIRSLQNEIVVELPKSP
jgi:osmotically-inducible protein OsmY